MKPIKEMTLPEIIEYMDDMGIDYELWDRHDPIDEICNRLREIHDLTRWIPVSERMPEDEGVVRVYTGLFDTYGESYGRWCEDANRWFVDGTNCGGDVTHWEHLEKPEGA